MGKKKTMKCKRGISFLLSVVLTAGLAVTGAIPGTSVTVSAADYDLYEDFDSCSGNGDLKGYTFGNPTLTLVEDPNGGQALKVSNREQNYYAYAYNLNKYRGNTVKVTFDVQLPDNVSTSLNVNATMKTTKSGEDDQYNWVGGVSVDGSDWKVGNVCNNYDIPLEIDSADIYFETSENIDYVIDNVSIEVVGTYQDPSNAYADFSDYAVLKDLYKDYFLFGSACEAISHWNINLSEIGNPSKEALILKEYNSITFGNELKPAYNMGYNSADATEINLPFVINPAAKEMLEWAKSNNMKVRGHVLVWHSQCPDAVFCKGYNPVYTNPEKGIMDPDCLVDSETMRNRLEAYIDSTMKYMYENAYADVIYAWDVVNEAVEPGTNADDLRNSYWYKIMGPDFMYYAFKYAREYSVKYAKEYAALYGIDPEDEEALKLIEPKLFYNDYNEFQEEKKNAIISILTTDINGHNIKNEGYIDGVGMQAHLSDNTNIDAFVAAMKDYSDYIGEVHITELDVTQTSSGINAEYYQAAFYNNLFKALIEKVNEGVNLTSVTVWGLTDDNSWKKETSPLLFNGNLSKKQAFDGVVYAITGEELPGPAFEAPDFTDVYYNFEDSSDGITARGDSTINVQDSEVFDGKKSLSVTNRGANWHGASFDVTKFVGQTIDISAWVKSSDPEVKISADIDGLWPNIAAADTSSGDWVQIKGRYSIPSELTALKLYFETGNTADIYVDDLKVKLVGLYEGFEGNGNIATARGVGHMPQISVTDTDANSGSKSLLVTREETDANVKFDISKYIGRNINIEFAVKSNDTEINVGLDADEPVKLGTYNLTGAWNSFSFNYTVPDGISSAQIYIETNGNSDLYVDDFNVTVLDFSDDLENGAGNFGVRWGGAGTVEYVEDGASNHAVKLTGRDESYYGLVFDVSQFLGNEVEITCDVKTDDSEIYLSGDIDNVWPRYISADAKPGEYRTIGTVVSLPKDMTALKVYVETNGKSDIYVDNLEIKRVKIGSESKVTFDATPKVTETLSGMFTEGYLVSVPDLGEENVPLGWYTDKKFTNKWDFNTDKVTEDITLYAKWDNGGNNPNPPKPSSVELLVDRLYENILGRDASEEEKEDWLKKIENKEVDISIVVFEFFTSDEFKKIELTDEQYIDILYKTFFGRKADEAGKAYWSGALKAGNPRQSILSGFIESNEFEKLCGKAGVDRVIVTENGVPVNVNMYNFVKRLYGCCLSRAGETTGVEYWVNRMMTDNVTPGEAAKQFFKSKEFVDKNTTDKEYVDLLYKTFMDRNAEAGGAEYWIAKIKEGMTRDEVLEGFVASDEFTGLVKDFGL